MSREIRWDGHGWIRKEPQVECPMDDCIPLFSVDSSSFGDTINSISMPFRGWELLGEHIISERDRRREEAATQPKHWYVRVDAHGVAECTPAPSNHHGKGVIRGYDSGDMSFYITAKDEREAKAKAQEANHSLGVWIREYLA